MKFKCTALFLSMLAASTSFTASASTSAPIAPTPAAQVAPVDINDATPPLNKYGAVDVNANVPVSTQVPPKPAGFKDPEVNPLANNYSDLIPAQPSLNAASYVLLDANSGEVIAASNPNLRLAPASMTKLMLLYVADQELAAGNIHVNDQVTVPTVAWATGGSRMFLKPGQTVAVQDLISGIIVASGNDAAVTLATYIAGSQSSMVSLMNLQAHKLNMTNTHFTDIMGLPAPAHYSTAYDMALLGQAIMVQYPQYFSWFSQKYFKYGNITQPNFNKLLFIYPYATGMKTGSTNEAGYSLVGSAQMPNNPMRLVSVVMGTPDANTMAAESKSILTYGFRFFSDQLLYSAGTTLGKARIYGGSSMYVQAGVLQDMYVTVPGTSKQSISSKLQWLSGVEAPISKGQQVGSVVISLNGKVISTQPIVAMDDVGAGGSFRRAIDKVTKWF
ncbi:MAG: D-alanyl-D-alanine carboxypeptidase [Gammaproteobacteria bacterium]|jgi:D-alanyl-D-alanine carboxypeptidase (penicillin-binding protein 5/6)|nr:D-alanyl-D-alanine carboxypeptidase [Gammaproteobacteria bacterium]